MKEKYREYPEAVRQYHSYDLDPRKKCSKEEWLRLARHSERNKSIILSGMNEEEFIALAASMKETEEERDTLMRQWLMLRKETFRYCVESVREGTCDPLYVFHDEGEAMEFAEEVFHDEKNRRNHLSVQVCEGRYDRNGWMLDEIPDVRIIAEWNDDESVLN